jgi:hypothetical protein
LSRVQVSRPWGENVTPVGVHIAKPPSYRVRGGRSRLFPTSHTSARPVAQKRRYVRLRGNRRGMAGDGAPDMASLAGDTGECVYSTYVYTLAGDTGECVYSTYVYTPAGVKLILKRVRKLLAILDIGSNPPKLLDDHLLYRRRYGRRWCTGGVAGNGYSAQLGISCLCIPKTAGNADIWCTRQHCISARSASPGSCTARHGR